MDKYKEYKDVSMGWLGRIPAHWTTVPLKYSIGKSPFSFVDGDWIESKVIESEGIRYLTTGNVGVINYKEQGNGFISDKTFRELNCTEVFPGDVLISRLNFPIGRSCIVPDLGYRIVVAVDNVIFRPDETKYNKKYLVYQMNCYPYSENANFIARGSTMQRITRTQLGALKLCVPPLEEQNAMVGFLDKKCSEIDNVISAQQKRIALLQELKQSVITHAVTKGLNPNVKMKDSGVEWIGKIPASWDVVHLKRILRERMQYGANEPAESDDTTYPRYIRITDITANGELRPETFKSLEPSKAKDYLLDKGDVLFARSGATVGKTFLFNADIKACYAGYLIKASCDKRRMLPEYLYYYTQSGAYECWKNSVFIQSTIQNIGADKYQMMYIPVPSKDEQKQIVEYTMRKSQIFDAAISKAQHQVELLQEYKQSLITEVVTGKRKVS